MAFRMVRTVEVGWRGSMPRGTGRIALGSGAFTGPYSLRSRVENEPGTNPEELLGAADAGCFTMSLADLLDKEGFVDQTLSTSARVYLEETATGFSITRIELTTVGWAEGLTGEQLSELAEQAKATCPISRALAAVTITVSAQLGTGPAE